MRTPNTLARSGWASTSKSPIRPPRRARRGSGPRTRRPGAAPGRVVGVVDRRGRSSGRSPARCRRAGREEGGDLRWRSGSQSISIPRSTGSPASCAAWIASQCSPRSSVAPRATTVLVPVAGLGRSGARARCWRSPPWPVRGPARRSGRSSRANGGRPRRPSPRGPARGPPRHRAAGACGSRSARTANPNDSACVPQGQGARRSPRRASARPRSARVVTFRFGVADRDQAYVPPLRLQQRGAIGRRAEGLGAGRPAASTASARQWNACGVWAAQRPAGGRAVIAAPSPARFNVSAAGRRGDRAVGAADAASTASTARGSPGAGRRRAP